jgi:hypothetical protein
MLSQASSCFCGECGQARGKELLKDMHAVWKEKWRDIIMVPTAKRFTATKHAGTGKTRESTQEHGSQDSLNQTCCEQSNSVTMTRKQLTV